MSLLNPATRDKEVEFSWKFRGKTKYFGGLWQFRGKTNGIKPVCGIFVTSRLSAREHHSLGGVSKGGGSFGKTGGVAA